MAKATDAMRVLVKHVQVRSAHAPKEGFVLSAMTREQIEDGEFGADTWWHEGVSMSYTDDYLNEIASDVTLNSSKVYEAVGSALLYEHKEGYTDLTPFFEDGFVNVPEGDGYYLDLEYRYTTSPTADLLDNTDADVVCVRKYIPLKPVLRGHHQVIKVMINSNEIIVNGSTEVSEETPGEW